VAAREEELQPLVGNRRLVHVVRGARDGEVEELRLRRQRPVAPDPVDCAVASGGDEPAPRILRRAVPRPTLGRDRECLLRGLLGELEIAEETDQRGDDAAPLVAEDLLDDR
jgi:hypothetical protein